MRKGRLIVSSFSQGARRTDMHYRVIKASLPATLCIGQVGRAMSRKCSTNVNRGVWHYLAADVALKDASIASAHKVGHWSLARRRLGGLFRDLCGRVLGGWRRGGLRGCSNLACRDDKQ